MLLHDLEAAPLEGRPPGYERVEGRAEGVDVGGRPDRAPVGLLGGHVFGRPDDVARLRQDDRRVARRHAPREPEVAELGNSVGEEDVPRLHVPVDETGLVNRGETARDGGARLHRLRPGEATPRPDALGERASRDELGHEEREPRGLARAVELDDVRMRDLRGEASLPPEPLGEVGVGGELARQHLDGHVASQEIVVRAVDDPDRAAPELLQDLDAP